MGRRPPYCSNGCSGHQRLHKGAPETKYGAFESYKQNDGSKGPSRSDISCACHWAVNQAAAENAGNLYRDAYVATPGAVMVRLDSSIRKPEQLENVAIAVGYHSGSHFTTVQALEAFLKPDQIKLAFIGAPMKRLDAIFDGDVEAVTVWGLSFQILEQLEFRRVADATFAITFMFPKDTDPANVEKYMRGLKRAQMEIDLHPERYKKHYLKEIPERFKNMVDVRLFGTGERIVFLPYTDSAFEQTQDWMKKQTCSPKRRSDRLLYYQSPRAFCGLARVRSGFGPSRRLNSGRIRLITFDY